MDFGDKLKQIRMNEGLSQEQLAEKIGVSRQAITKWETKKGMPDVENMIILSEIFKMTLDELIMQETRARREEKVCFESETVYDIDAHKHFDIHMGSVRSISLRSGSDEKIHIKLESDTLENLGSLFKIKLDEKKNKIDIDCVKQKGTSKYEAEESVDVFISLPKDYTSHLEVEASTKALCIKGLSLERLEYDGDASDIFIKDVVGSLEFTGKTDYHINIEGVCTKLDVNQWCAKTFVEMPSLDNYSVINKGRKCSVYYKKDGMICEDIASDGGENMISISGISSELIIETISKA